MPGASVFLQEGDNREDIKPVDGVKAKAKASPNLALYDDMHQPNEVVAHAMHLATQAYAAYQIQWQQQSIIWQNADNYYWMAQKKHRMPELTRAEVSASTYYITSRRLADGAYLVSFPSGNAELPIVFQPTSSTFDASDSKRRRAIISDGLNTLALEYARKTDLAAKCKKIYYSTYKYANSFAYVPWEYKVEKKKSWQNVNKNLVHMGGDGSPVFTHKDSGEVSRNPFPAELEEVERDVVTQDGMGFTPLKPESCFMDSMIEDINRQTCFLWRSFMTRPEIFAEGRSGNYKNIDQISQLQRWGLFTWESQVENQRRTDANQTIADSYESEVYERWQIWMLLPKIKVKTNKKGEATSLEWDQNAEERRYKIEIIGQINGPYIVVNFQESPYWGNGIPFLMFHSHEDDVSAYHRGLPHLLEDQMIQEQVAKGQLMDNRTLLNFRPLTVLSGRVKNKSLKIGYNTAFHVTSQDAIKQLEVADISGTIGNTLQYIKDETESVAQTPKFFLGQGIGGRTSATEFSAIRDQGSAPALNDIKTLNLQIVGGWLRKMKEYIPQFLDKDVLVKRNGDNGKEVTLAITSDEFDADMELKEIAVTAFDSKSTTRQIVINLIQGVLSSPLFQGMINPVGVFIRLMEMFPEVTPNPEELLIKDPRLQQALIEYQKQKAMEQDIKQQVPQPPPSPQMGMTTGFPSSGTPPRPSLGNMMPFAGNSDAQPVNAAMGAAKGV